MTKLHLIGLALAVLIIGGAFWISGRDGTLGTGGADTGTALVPPGTGTNLVAAAAATGQLGTFARAADAGLATRSLSEDGPLTVFAPSDSAFAALPPGSVEALLAPANARMLQETLSHHVVAGRYTLADLVDGQVLTTFAGATLTVGKVGTTTTINGAPIVTADVLADNGVIHVIGSVLVPDGGK